MMVYVCIFRSHSHYSQHLEKKERVKREESKWPRGELVAVSGDLKRFPASSGGGEGAAS